MRKLFFIVFLTGFLSGCVSWRSEQGVENLWRSDSFPVLAKGVTTQAEIMTLLGPPSQIINLEDQVVFYYLREEKKGSGFILILYNYSKIDVEYDRAIFFFDKKGILTNYSFSRDTLGGDEGGP